MNKVHFTDYWSGIVGASLLGGIAIAWAAVLLPVHGTTAAPGNGQADIRRSMSNVALKGDRLVGMHSRFGEEPAVGEAPTGKSVAKIPVGCDPAFSKTVRHENFAARCIT
ncbi:MAG TPA: hypothetical protein VMV19_05035 [Xanthobacteraceae bacterium]|nr:hypothetical protein [Xanthobacteraceae bacterium]